MRCWPKNDDMADQLGNRTKMAAQTVNVIERKGRMKIIEGRAAKVKDCSNQRCRKSATLRFQARNETGAGVAEKLRGLSAAVDVQCVVKKTAEIKRN